MYTHASTVVTSTAKSPKRKRTLIVYVELQLEPPKGVTVTEKRLKRAVKKVSVKDAKVALSTGGRNVLI